MYFSLPITLKINWFMRHLRKYMTAVKLMLCSTNAFSYIDIDKSLCKSRHNCRSHNNNNSVSYTMCVRAQWKVMNSFVPLRNYIKSGFNDFARKTSSSLLDSAKT